MGYYIQTVGNLFKATNLEYTYNAQRIAAPSSFDQIPSDQALICVVENGIFDAAGLVYNENEFEAFNDPTDFRPRTWLLMNKETAHKLAGYEERE